MLSDEIRRRYAYAVLSGAMTRKEAYLQYVNPSAECPTRSAGQLHKSKQMQAILGEVGREIEAASSIRLGSTRIAEKQLRLADSILDDSDSKSEAEKLAILRVLKPVQDNALNVLKQLDRPLDEALAAAQTPEMRRRSQRGNFMMANRQLQAGV
jgi:hypothetical protein